MKKIAFIMAIVVLLSFSGCQSKEPSGNDNSSAVESRVYKNIVTAKEVVECDGYVYFIHDGVVYKKGLEEETATKITLFEENNENKKYRDVCLLDCEDLYAVIVTDTENDKSRLTFYNILEEKIEKEVALSGDVTAESITACDNDVYYVTRFSSSHDLMLCLLKSSGEQMPIATDVGWGYIVLNDKIRYYSERDKSFYECNLDGNKNTAIETGIDKEKSISKVIFYNDYIMMSTYEEETFIYNLKNKKLQSIPLNVEFKKNSFAENYWYTYDYHISLKIDLDNGTYEKFDDGFWENLNVYKDYIYMKKVFAANEWEMFKIPYPFNFCRIGVDGKNFKQIFSGNVIQDSDFFENVKVVNKIDYESEFKNTHNSNLYVIGDDVCRLENDKLKVLYSDQNIICAAQDKDYIYFCKGGNSKRGEIFRFSFKDKTVEKIADEYCQGFLVYENGFLAYTFSKNKARLQHYNKQSGTLTDVPNTYAPELEIMINSFDIFENKIIFSQLGVNSINFDGTGLKVIYKQEWVGEYYSEMLIHNKKAYNMCLMNDGWGIYEIDLTTNERKVILSGKEGPFIFFVSDKELIYNYKEILYSVDISSLEEKVLVENCPQNLVSFSGAKALFVDYGKMYFLDLSNGEKGEVERQAIS